MTRAWLHHCGLLSLATPVLVLSCGPERARVRLVHRLRWERKWYPAGSTRYVPSYALSDRPRNGYLVSVGNSRFVLPMKPEAIAMVKRHSRKGG